MLKSLPDRISFILKSNRGNLDNVPSVIIDAVVKRVFEELQDILPIDTTSAEFDCKVSELFDLWGVCQCGNLIPKDRAFLSDDEVILCPTCITDMQPTLRS